MFVVAGILGELSSFQTREREDEELEEERKRPKSEICGILRDRGD